MLVLLIGLVTFLGVHSVSIVDRSARDRLAARLGEGPWKGLYSLVAAAGLVLIVVGYGLARQDPVVIWNPPTFMRHIALLVMIPVFPLLFAAYLPGRIKDAARHPMLVAVKLWALAHLLANGTLADVVLFGSLLAWAVVDRISVKRRPATSATAPAAAPRKSNDLVALAGGLAVYVLFVVGLHEWLFGVPPVG